jgi:hypothetical protein
MINVVEFPAADREFTEFEVDRLHSKAFRDLEGSIGDCMTMAQIAAQMITNEAGVGGEVVFAVCHAFDMLKKLNTDLSGRVPRRTGHRAIKRRRRSIRKTNRQRLGAHARRPRR